MKNTMLAVAVFFAAVLLHNKTASAFDKVLLFDNFSKLDTGLLTPPGIGPHAEYHFLKSLMPKGNWTVSCFQSREADHAWRVKDVNGERVIEQSFNNPVDFTHPTIDAGNEFWGDYKMEVAMSPLVQEGRAGLLFRVHNDRCYYFFGMNNQKIALLKLNHGTAYRVENRVALAEKDFSWQTSKKYLLTVEVVGNKFTASIDGQKVFTATDELFARGKIGLTSDKPARFYSVKVSATNSEVERIARESNTQSREWKDLQAKNPKLKVWKKMSTKGFGTWRNVRFGDLNGDGQMDILIGQVEDHSYPWNSFSELSCLTAMTFDGKILWQTGKPKKIPHELANDVAFQIYDIDGDRKEELFMGYSMFKDNPTPVYSWDAKVKDHNDGVAAVNFRAVPDAGIEVFSAASDEGMIVGNTKGDILKHYYVGHVQNPAIANFRDDLPGLETVTVNFWSKQGIFHLLDSSHNIYKDMEPINYGSMCLPINWTGKSEEFFVISANVVQGGMFDGWGRKVVDFPDDGHPDLCNAVLDIKGDVRDEVVVWDETDLWVYTQDDSPLKGKLYQPVRNQMFNYSNYQLTVSEPGWSR